MKCTKCGIELSDGAAFCYKCGAAVTAPEPEVSSAPEPEPAPEATAEPVCGKCGETLVPGQQFCHKCGTAADDTAVKASAAPAKPKKERKPLSKKAKAGLIVLATAIVIAAAIVLPLEIPRYTADAHDWTSYVSDTVLYVANERGQGAAFDGEYAELSGSSADGSIVTVIEYGDERDDYTLWMVRGDKKTEIADDVISHTISDNGDVIVYFERASDSFDTVRMMRCITATDEKQPVEASLPAAAADLVTLSPDGRSIAYVAKMEGNEYTMRCDIDGQTVSIRGNCAPLGIADGGKYIYYMENDDSEFKLYCSDGSESTLLHDPDGERVISNHVTFNADMSQMLYCTEYGTYLSENGKESVLLDDRKVSYLVCPYNTLASGSVLGIRYGVSSLYGKTYTDGGELYYMDKDGLHKMAAGSSAELSKRLDVLAFMRDDELFVATPGRNGAQTVKRLSDPEHSVTSYALSRDGVHIYYTDTDGTLWYAATAKPGKTKLIAYGVDDYNMGFHAASNDFWFIADDDLLFVSTGGANKKIVSDGIVALDAYANSLRFSGSPYDIDDDMTVCDVYGPRGTGIELIIDAVDTTVPEGAV